MCSTAGVCISDNVGLKPLRCRALLAS